ncbi:MAG: hypothetical protein E7122_00470 [Bacteroidales bacterium]|nr:hypothetical protein [Bacteroidales bacterium]
MKKRGVFQLVLAFALLLQASGIHSMERVYVSTDKELYLAGESIWCSVFCIDESTGKYSQFSSVAYLEFHSKRGIEALIKVAMIDGRGCGRLQVPFSFATGNCTIVAYTSKDGGDSKGEFNGKTVTVFNTLSSDKVKDGVEVVEKGEPVMAPEHKPVEDSGAISIEVGEQGNGAVPVKIRNAGGDGASFSVSVYHIDGIEDIIGKRGYDNTSLLERKGDFEVTGIEEYAGEMIRTRVFRDGKPLRGNDAKGVYMYMSAMGNTDDTYIANVDSLGYATYYTNNISGKRDLLFDVVTNVRQTAKIGSGAGSGNDLRVEKVEGEFKHIPAEIPVLKISGELEEPLKKRSMRMQVGRRFEQDTLFNLMPMRSNDFFGAVEPIVYNLDDYTRFPLMKEVISEYVSNLRVRMVEGEERLLVLWQETEGVYTVSRQYALALLDGVPVRDHSKIINMDPLLVKQIIIYPRRYLLNYFMFDGIVKFNTYKGDMGGMKLGEDVNILSHDGPQYPLAFMGDRIPENGRYPNYNSTIYWNPVVDMDKDGVYEFNCPLPDYKGNFRIVVEGIDGAGNGIYKEAVVSIE